LTIADSLSLASLTGTKVMAYSARDDVDCYRKWLEMALLVGVKPVEVG